MKYGYQGKPYYDQLQDRGKRKSILSRI